MKPKATFVTLYDDNRAQIGDITSDRMVRYCASRGYRPLVFRRLLEPAVHPAWNKLWAVEQALKLEAEGNYVVWVDADVLVLDAEVDIIQCIENHVSSAQAYFSVDTLCTDPSESLKQINTGFFVIRNNAWSRALIEMWKVLGECQPRHRVTNETSPRHDQDTLRHIAVCYPAVSEKFSFISPSLIQNQTSDFELNAFAYHYWASGKSQEKIAEHARLTVERGYCSKF